MGCQYRCINTIGHYECNCPEGQSLATDGRSCSSCKVSLVMLSFLLHCSRLLSLLIFTASSWCLDKGCQHSCKGEWNSYSCTCFPGYELAKNGKNCTSTCSVGNGGCQHRCTMTSDGPICTCHHKYILGIDRKSCSRKVPTKDPILSVYIGYIYL